MKNFGDRLEAYLQMNMSIYLNESGMISDGIWATDAEILGAASLFETDIVVYSQFGRSLKWLCYPASLSLDRLSHEAIFLS